MDKMTCVRRAEQAVVAALQAGVEPAVVADIVYRVRLSAFPKSRKRVADRGDVDAELAELRCLAATEAGQNG